LYDKQRKDPGESSKGLLVLQIESIGIASVRNGGHSMVRVESVFKVMMGEVESGSLMLFGGERCGRLQ
jgi:hypothetical protein